MSNTGEGSVVPLPEGGTAGYRGVGPERTVRADRAWWDASAAGYLAEHGADLADRLLWGPEGLDEATAGLLGDPAGRDVLEVGAGAGQGAAWLAGRGARAVASDLSAGMLRHAPRSLPRLVADARRLPFAAGSFDLVFTAYGALPFVADPERVHAEVARVLRPGGRWVFSVTHPIRWAFPDDPGPRGLTAGFSYFDRTAYAETDPAGEVAYAEHHRTIGDRVRELVAAGFVLEDVVEPEWAEGRDLVWGGWSRERGELLPGTAIFVSRRG